MRDSETGVSAESATEEERTWSMLAHLLAFLGMVVPLGNVIAPAVIGRLKKRSLHVWRHGRASLNFQINMSIHAFLAGFLLEPYLQGLLAEGHLKVAGPWPVALLFLYGLVVWIGWIVLVMVTVVRGHQGRIWLYPLTVPFLKEEAAAKKG